MFNVYLTNMSDFYTTKQLPIYIKYQLKEERNSSK